MSEMNSVVRSDSEILGGTPVFRGTRVPVRNLIDYLEAGDSLEVFRRPPVRKAPLDISRVWLSSPIMSKL